jgi:hypothetical protein
MTKVPNKLIFPPIMKILKLLSAQEWRNTNNDGHDQLIQV